MSDVSDLMFAIMSGGGLLALSIGAFGVLDAYHKRGIGEKRVDWLIALYAFGVVMNIVAYVMLDRWYIARRWRSCWCRPSARWRSAAPSSAGPSRSTRSPVAEFQTSNSRHPARGAGCLLAPKAGRRPFPARPHTANVLSCSVAGAGGVARHRRVFCAPSRAR